jgi:hypothetical protein
VERTEANWNRLNSVYSHKECVCRYIVCYLIQSMHMQTKKPS